MKKGLKIAGITLAVIFVLLLILPFAFQGKIKDVVKSEANKMLNAKLEFSDLSLSLIRNFPNASVTLKDISLSGINEFEGDTLIKADNAHATVNIMSLFGDAGYEISKIKIEHASVLAKVSEDGKANWDIMKDDEKKGSEDSDTTSTAFKLKLKSVEIKKSSIVYDDRQAKIKFAADDLDLTLSGDLTSDRTTVKTDFKAQAVSVIMENIPYLSKAVIQGDVQVDADLQNMKFTLKDNTISVNAISASVDGWIALLDDDSMDMDIKLNAPETQFKDILSLIPAIYAKDFEQIKTSGTATLDAYAKGLMKGDTLPSFDVKLTIANAMFQYPDLPKAVTDIAVNARITNPGGDADLTVIDVPKFHFSMGGNPFDVNLHLTNPVSDPNFSLGAKGKLNLGMIKDIYPLEDGMQLNGILDANLKVAARMSTIEKEQYDKVNAEGTLAINDMTIKSNEMSDIHISNAMMSFTPRYVDLSSLNVKIGQNDLAATGKLENFIPYALKNETLRGSLNVNSGYLNLNDFMSDSPAAATAETSAEEPVAVFEVPKNIDFSLNGNFKKVLFDNLTMNNVIGQIIVRGGKVDMKNLGMSALGGAMTLNGSYDTSKNPKQPHVDMALNLKNVSFSETFKTFTTVQKLVPIFEALGGNFSTTFNLNTDLGNDFMPNLTTLSANGLLQSNNVDVQNVPAVNALAGALKNDKLKSFNIKDLNLPFSIASGRVTTKPFDVNMGSIGKMNLSGTTGLDQSIDYVAKVDLPDSKISSYVKSMNVKIGGTFTSPKISLDYADVASQALGNALGAVTGGAISNLGDVSAKGVEEAQKQADKIVAQAKESGDKLVAEAQKQADAAVAKVSNPLAKAAAQQAANAAVAEARKRADQMNVEAEKQAKQLVDAAKEKTQK